MYAPGPWVRNPGRPPPKRPRLPIVSLGSTVHESFPVPDGARANVTFREVRLTMFQPQKSNSELTGRLFQKPEVVARAAILNALLQLTTVWF